MLTAVPLVIILGVPLCTGGCATGLAVAVVAVAFMGGWFWNPPYGFSPGDNFAYRDYAILHQDGEHSWRPAIPWRTRSPLARFRRIDAALAGLCDASGAGSTNREFFAG